MSTIRVVYEQEPNFPAADQHPDAVRHRIVAGGREYVVDAVGGAPTEAEVLAVLSPPEVPKTDPVEKLAQYLADNPDVASLVSARKA